MELYRGKGVVPGIAIGRLYVFEKGKEQVEKISVADTEAEVVRFQSARGQAMEQLDKLYQDALSRVGEENAQIFEDDVRRP